MFIMILSNKRKLTICKQIFIKDIFNKFHNNLLFSNSKKVTNIKQVIAIGLSIGSKQCKNIKIKKKILKSFDVKDILALLKKNELIKIIQIDNNILDYKNKSKKVLYKKFLNKKELIDKLYILL